MPMYLKESIARRREVVRDDQIIEGRSALLARKDRDLLRAIWLDGQSAQRVADMAGVPAPRIRRRVLRLIERIGSKEFLAAARSLPSLRGPHAAVARLCFCQGLTERATAERMGESYHHVRRWVIELRGILRLYDRPAAG